MWFKSHLIAVIWLITVFFSPAVEARVPTKLTLRPSSGLTGGCSSVEYSGKLTRADTGVGVANATIELYLRGTKIGETTTNGFGNYLFRFPYVEQLTAGQHQKMVRFRGNNHFHGTNASNVHRNQLGSPTLSVRNRSAKVGTNVHLRVDMSNYGKLPVAGRRVYFFYNGRAIGDATTNANGVAKITIRVTTPGINTVRAEFRGDTHYYRAASASGWINGT